MVGPGTGRVPDGAHHAARARRGARRLTVDSDGVSEQVMIGYHEAAKLPGYAEAFDILDAVVRQLSGDAVPYPTSQSTIVHDRAEVSSR